MVNPITAGRRRTLVIALRAPLPENRPLPEEYVAATAAVKAAAVAGTVASGVKVTREEEEAAVPSRAQYWSSAEESFQYLCDGPLQAEPKVCVPSVQRERCPGNMSHGRGGSKLSTWH